MLTRASLAARLARLEKRTYGVGAMDLRAIINLTVDGVAVPLVEPAPRHPGAVISLTIGAVPEPSPVEPEAPPEDPEEVRRQIAAAEAELAAIRGCAKSRLG
jgi:hypothetical protein